MIVVHVSAFFILFILIVRDSSAQPLYCMPYPA